MKLTIVLCNGNQYENVTDMDHLKGMIDALVAQVKALDKEELKKAAAAMA